MAKKKRKAAKRRVGKRKAAKRSRKAAKRCKVTRVKGQGMRRICRNAKGQIKSNTKA